LALSGSGSDFSSAGVNVKAGTDITGTVAEPIDGVFAEVSAELPMVGEGLMPTCEVRLEKTEATELTPSAWVEVLLDWSLSSDDDVGMAARGERPRQVGLPKPNACGLWTRDRRTNAVWHRPRTSPMPERKTDTGLRSPGSPAVLYAPCFC